MDNIKTVEKKGDVLVDINNIILFASYICVSDGLIHDKEIQSINTFLKANNISKETREKVNHILGDTEDKISLDVILNNLKEMDYDNLKQALIIGLNIAYSDGFFAPAEEAIIENFLDVTNFNHEDYMEIKEIIIAQKLPISQKQTQQSLLSIKAERVIFLMQKKTL